MERQTIMLVDDAELNRMMLKEILGDQYDYVEAADGREAVYSLEKNLMVDLMLLDLNMPQMNGFEVLEQMNRFQWINEIPVIIISADETDQAIRKAYNMGVTDYIRRPFDTVIVRRRVENTLNLYANQKRLAKLVYDQLYEKEENCNMMVGILSNVVGFCNHESSEHIRNIRAVTEILLRRLTEKTDIYNLSENDIALIRTASALHDIGKIAVPEEILNKPGKLTAEEFAIMKTHAQAGEKILKSMTYEQDKPLLCYARQICRWHHERADGSGYPDGLRGEHIPIAAQVVALADVYDALTNKRCYKEAFDHDTAIAMIKRGECGAFNPLLLECLLDTADKIRIASDFSESSQSCGFEVSRLSKEIMAHAEVPRNDRVQRLLDSMQERIDFFASCSKGIQFEYDSLSKRAEVVNQDALPGQRHTVMDISDFGSFHRLGLRDFNRIKAAMDATTRETPEFTMSVMLLFGREYHWCDLRVRTLWSHVWKDHYIGAVGHLTDTRREAEKECPPNEKEAGRAVGESRIAEDIRGLEKIFDIVRIVDPETNSVLELDGQGNICRTENNCAAFWDNGAKCTNCISSKALAQKKTFNKLEFTHTEMYFVIAKYICLNGTPCVLEMLSRMNEGRWIDANGRRLLLDSSRNESMELFKDSVTNVYSRRYFDTYKVHLEGMEGTCVIDVDSFKQVNDTFGHQAGDTVLKEIADAIRSCIHSTDILIRYGGDEFLLLFPEMEKNALEKKGMEIQDAVGRIVIGEYPDLHLSVSVGGVLNVYPITEAIRQADEAMYKNKEKHYANIAHKA